ncbi:MAG: hypothetical protein IKN54_08140 [Lachnospiraceae bacterium]|nr:hypothetical protein [Lachnospiraceae bacterium]
MKKNFLLLQIFFGLTLISCSGNAIAALNQQREADTAKYQSEYGVIKNKLELEEANFKSYRKTVFYNVRLGETVFACEGYSHIQIDEDGDVEIVIKTGEKTYLRHFLETKPDITYFSEELNSTEIENYHYQIVWNPKLWIPEFTNITK